MTPGQGGSGAAIPAEAARASALDQVRERRDGQPAGDRSQRSDPPAELPADERRRGAAHGGHRRGHVELPRLPHDRGVGHAHGPRPRDGVPRPMHRDQDAQHPLRTSATPTAATSAAARAASCGGRSSGSTAVAGEGELMVLPELEFYIFDDVRYTTTMQKSSYQVDAVEASWNTDADDAAQPRLQPRPGGRPARRAAARPSLRGAQRHRAGARRLRRARQVPPPRARRPRPGRDRAALRAMPCGRATTCR